MTKTRPLWKLVLVVTLAALTCGTVSCREVETGPRAWIDHPRDGSSVPVGATITLIAHAQAPGGVAEVLFTVNGEPYRRGPPDEPGATFSQVRLEWLPEAEGDYTLQVTAYDAAGEASSPASITIRVGSAVAEVPTLVPEAPTDTPVPTVTPVEASPTPTPAPNTPTPTAVPFTPTPTSPPDAEVNFWADQYSITSGECTTLRWDVTNATAVFLEGAPVTGQGSQEVCPTSTTTYNLHVEAPSGNVDQAVTITVSTPVDNTPPPIPSLDEPADGAAVDCVSSVILSWHAVSDPSGVTYYVKLERQVTATEWTTVRGWGPQAEREVDADVDCGIIYRWAVRAQDGAGNFSDWSEWFQFGVSLD